MNTHNPSGLTDDQIQTSLGYRLLDEDEIRRGEKPMDAIERWSKTGKGWSYGNFVGDAIDYTYRTCLTREQLAEKRGLKPKEKAATAFDEWLDEQKPFANINGETNRLRAAFLAGQRSERQRIAAMLIGRESETVLRMLQKENDAASREPKGAQP